MVLTLASSASLVARGVIPLVRWALTPLVLEDRLTCREIAVSIATWSTEWTREPLGTNEIKHEVPLHDLYRLVGLASTIRNRARHTLAIQALYVIELSEQFLNTSLTNRSEFATPGPRQVAAAKALASLLASRYPRKVDRDIVKSLFAGFATAESLDRAYREPVIETIKWTRDRP